MRLVKVETTELLMNKLLYGIKPEAIRPRAHLHVQEQSAAVLKTLTGIFARF